MFSLFKRQRDRLVLDDYIQILTDKPVKSWEEVSGRCQAVEALARLGPAAHAAMPALLRTLVVPVSVDCGLILRVAVAEALWKVDQRRDLALPFLAWALADEYWGVSRQAAQVLSEMGGDAHDAIPALVQLAERRCAHGPFHFERAEHIVGASFVSLLAVVATALGQCGRGVAHWQEAHAMLTRLTAFQEEDVRTAAMRALDDLGSPLASNLVGRRT